MSNSTVITYSPAFTIVPTYECFNRCSYCNFRVDPHQDRWLTLQRAQGSLKAARSRSVIEILVLSGEVHPRSDRRQQWLQHIIDLCQLALDWGFLPHTNVGPLSTAEMTALKQVNVSMGLMLEQMTPALLQGVHRHAPSKRPELRLQQLEQAGRLRIPFTTGLLLGIGESPADRVATLRAIAHCHRRWGHIQEVILQPHQPGTHQSEARPAFTDMALANFVVIAREELPADIAIQVPPNLLKDQQALTTAIANGASDLGGLGPIDEVNPDYDHPTPAMLQPLLKEAGYQLAPRLPIYPQYWDWLAAPLRQAVDRWCDVLARQTAFDFGYEHSVHTA